MRDRRSFAPNWAGMLPLILVSAVASRGVERGESLPPFMRDDGGPLPGKAVSTQEAVHRAGLIAVSEVLDLGSVTPGPLGQMSFSSVKIKVVKSLKGRARGELRLFLPVRKSPKAKEATPEAGKEYLFLLEDKRPGTCAIVKILRPSEENLEKLKDILAKGDE